MSDTFSWKRTGLAEAGQKGIGSGHGQGGKSIRSFALKTFIVGGIGMKKLQSDWWVKVEPFLGGVTTQTYVCVGVC